MNHHIGVEMFWEIINWWKCSFSTRKQYCAGHMIIFYGNLGLDMNTLENLFAKIPSMKFAQIMEMYNLKSMFLWWRLLWSRVQIFRNITCFGIEPTHPQCLLWYGTWIANNTRSCTVHADNVPGARCMWESTNGAMWIFGGYRKAPDGMLSSPNVGIIWFMEIWGWSIWTFVSGSTATTAKSV